MRRISVCLYSRGKVAARCFETFKNGNAHRFGEIANIPQFKPERLLHYVMAMVGGIKLGTSYGVRAVAPT